MEYYLLPIHFQFSNSEKEGVRSREQAENVEDYPVPNSNLKVKVNAYPTLLDGKTRVSKFVKLTSTINNTMYTLRTILIFR